MKRRTFGLGLAAAPLCLATSACPGKRGGQSQRDPNRILAPALALPDLKGEYVSLQGDLAGKVVLVNIWATWCKPCRAELPELARLHRELGPRGFEVLAVNIDTERLESKVRKMTADFDLPFTVLRDPEGSVVGPWQVVGYPTSFLIGRESELLWRRDGIIFEQDPELGALLETSLAAKAS